jgi:hypothetical protein
MRYWIELYLFVGVLVLVICIRDEMIAGSRLRYIFRSLFQWVLSVAIVCLWPVALITMYLAAAERKD